MPETHSDLIDALAGVRPGSSLDRLRALRPDARTHAQASYRALFTPDETGDVPLQERFAVASFVAGLHGEPKAAAFYLSELAGAGGTAELRKAVEMAIAEAATEGPYGDYPAGPLSRENLAGLTYQPGAETARSLGPRLSAALGQAHLLVFHPRDASPRGLQALLDAGWSIDGIVTLSQLVAFLSFQIRAIAGLGVLAASSDR